MKALVLFSGGLDSTTCLALAIEKYGAQNVIALSITYGQKHDKEALSAKAVAEHYGVELLTLDLARIFEGSDCTLLKGSKDEIPKGDYAQQLESTDGKPVSTYVPFRNGLSCPAQRVWHCRMAAKSSTTAHIPMTPQAMPIPTAAASSTTI